MKTTVQDFLSENGVRRILVVVLLLVLALTLWNALNDMHLYLKVSMKAPSSGLAVLYFDDGNGFNEESKSRSFVRGDGRLHELHFKIRFSATIFGLRFDPPSLKADEMIISGVELVDHHGWVLHRFSPDRVKAGHQIKRFSYEKEGIRFIVADGADDPQIQIQVDNPLKMPRLRVIWNVLRDILTFGIVMFIACVILIFLWSRWKNRIVATMVVFALLGAGWVVYKEMRLFYSGSIPSSLKLVMKSDVQDSVKIYYDCGFGFNEADMAGNELRAEGDFRTYHFDIPEPFFQLRLDPLTKQGTVVIREMEISNRYGERRSIPLQSLKPVTDIRQLEIRGNGELVVAVDENAKDPQIKVENIVDFSPVSQRAFPALGFVKIVLVDWIGIGLLLAAAYAGYSILSRQNFAALLLVLFFFLISNLSIQEKSWTFDEPKHYEYGLNILNGNSSRNSLDPFASSKMPVSAWNVLPAKVGSFLPGGTLKAGLEKTVTARMMTTFFSMAIALIVFHWARKLYGVTAAFVSLILYILDPNIIAHSRLVTTDVYIMGMMLASCYWLWRFADSRRIRHLLIFALMIALAQLTKYTAVSMYPLLLGALFLYDLLRWRSATGKGDGETFPRLAGRHSAYMVIVVAVSLIVINAGFLFNRSFTPFHDYSFRSDLFKSVQLDVRVPTPYPFLEGLDWIISQQGTGEDYGKIYMLSESRKVGFKGYYFVATLLKMPIATQLILLVAFLTYFIKARYRGSFWSKESFLLLPVLFYTIYFNFLYDTQVGIRYYLIVFPLLYVFAGSLFERWEEFPRVKRAVVFALGLYLVGSVISYYPNYIGYFNEIVWNRLDAHRYLADSNLDWGQDDFAMKKYLARHADVKEAPTYPGPIPATRRYYVRVNELVGVTRAPDDADYEWLRKYFRPTDRVGTSYLLYRITPEEMESLCARTSYCRNGNFQKADEFEPSHKKVDREAQL